MFKTGDKVTAATYETAAAWCNESNQYTIEYYTIVEIPSQTETQKAAEVRETRDRLLAETDRYMLSDYPVTDERRELYRQYRQYLRDIPSAADFPDIELLEFAKWFDLWS